MNQKQAALKELAKRELEKRYKPQRDDLVEYMKCIFEKEKGIPFLENWHHRVIADGLNKVLTGEITRLMVNIPPGHTKCLDPSTNVLTPYGNLLIKDLSVGDLVYGEKDRELVVQRVVAMEPEQFKKCLKVRTRTGRELIMSTDHRMLTFGGYKKANELTKDDYLYCLNSKINTSEAIDSDILTFLTHMIFEGGCSGRTLRYSNGDEAVVQDFKQACSNLGIEVKQYSCNNTWDYNLMGGMSGNAAKILEGYGLLGHKSYTKRLPQSFFTMPIDQKFRFIDIMIATDGCIAAQSGSALISLANEGLIDDIQTLLSMCGIISSKSFSANDHAGAWRLNIGGSQLQVIYDRCTLFHKRDKCAQVLLKNRYSKSDVYPTEITDGLNGYFARKNGCRIDNKKAVTPDRFEKLASLFPELGQYRNKDFFWDQVVSIEPAGERELIHIQTTGEQNFLANCLVSHNTELITKCFPVWALGNNPTLDICATGYSTSLTQTYSQQARDYYKSDTNKLIFPRLPDLRTDQDTKEHWTNEDGGSYFATGTGGSITGRRFNIFIIDDPMKPDDALSDIKRIGVNNWYENTVLSRLYSPLTDAVIIIMQRTHENDLCGHLLEKEMEGLGEKWEHINLPAIAEKDEQYRKEGEALDENRFPLEALELLKKSAGKVNFSCQYQQNPIAKESQEFHEEFFKYYEEAPKAGRVFTVVDPAFSKKETADYTAIITGKFVKDELYILEISHGRYDPAELEDKIIYHARKWKPEKIGVEAVAAQRMIGFSLKNRLRNEHLHIGVEEITQPGDKETKIRRLIPLYRNGQIYHKAGLCEVVEEQLIKFPRGAHDDAIDALQMLYNMYELQPNTITTNRPQFEYDRNGMPVFKKPRAGMFS